MLRWVQKRMMILRNFANYRVLSKSILFSAHFYLETNVDVQKAGLKPLVHYMIYGWKEGRNPSFLFDINYYLEHNQDVAEADVEPLMHYLTHGWKERRNPSPLFDINYYFKSGRRVAPFSPSIGQIVR